MQEPLISNFRSLDDAVAARDALLAAGLPADALELRELQDEAGPVEGNFLIGNGRTTHGGRPGAILAGREVPYEENFKHPAERGVHLLIVAPRNDVQRATARSLLDSRESVIVEDRAARAGDQLTAGMPPPHGRGGTT